MGITKHTTEIVKTAGIMGEYWYQAHCSCDWWGSLSHQLKSAAIMDANKHKEENSGKE